MSAGDAGQDAHFALSPDFSFMMWNAVESLSSDALKPFIIPLAGLLVGGVMMQMSSVSTVGKLVLYFGAQSFMNIYMGWVMRISVTIPKGTELANGHTLDVDLTGCPAGFALTAMQQVISFIVFCCLFAAVYPTPYRYMPKRLNSAFEVFAVIVFGCVFALNIALNNFSLGYMSIGLNLVIRSCSPLSTYVSQQALAVFDLYPHQEFRLKEIALMVLGVLCASVFILARYLGSQASGGDDTGGASMLLGVLVCVASLLCGSLNMALAGVLGETKLNVYDTVAYMAIPATLCLLPIAFFVQKPVPGAWPEVFGRTTMSDFEILKGVWSLNKRTMMWLALSGVFSFVYNIIQFSVVQTLSPSAAAFGGNFNKAALIFLTLLLPCFRVHTLPGAPYIQVIWVAVIVNIAAFSYYSYLQIQAKHAAPAQDAFEPLRGEKAGSDPESTAEPATPASEASSTEASFTEASSTLAGV
eukprot:CAMPEP_0198518722 /NCGR_PEP_ID=MMETSP1462-20131121/19280_1 /TAXON_ID=1333877 /ORGANISM="Brandtodinium nutriculum, Strain RCC3387" /LENGTH=469 /DNA_ID=CAMNT_0044248315 /DNA_START=79 /DNA_END=1488 /DNA_ORIENTATION=-